MKINEHGKNCLVFALKKMLRDIKVNRIPVSFKDECIEIKVKYKKASQKK